MTKAILSAGAGFILAMGLVWLLWTVAPYPLIDGPTYEALLETVLSAELAQSSSHQTAIYIQPDLKPVITRLQRRFPKWQLLPSSQRPDQHGCDGSGPCGKDFVAVDAATFPFWRTALVIVSSANSGAELLLVEIGDKWRIVSRKGFVI
jgi:hypothetical protein